MMPVSMYSGLRWGLMAVSIYDLFGSEEDGLEIFVGIYGGSSGGKVDSLGEVEKIVLLRLIDCDLLRLVRDASEPGRPMWDLTAALYCNSRLRESSYHQATAFVSRWMIHENLPVGLTPFWGSQSMRQSSISNNLSDPLTSPTSPVIPEAAPSQIHPHRGNYLRRSPPSLLPFPSPRDPPSPSQCTRRGFFPSPSF